MDGEMKHEEKHAEMEHGPHHGPMGPGPMHMGPREMYMMKRGWGWQNNWKSPISLGFFLLTASLALAIFLYTVLNLVGTILEATHPASQDGMSAQELQQLEQSAPASGGSTGSMPEGTGASAQ